MILICDSGSTKSEWAILNPINKRIEKELKSDGLHPTTLSEQKSNEISSLFAEDIGEIEEIHFYGSGCYQEVAKETIRIFLKTIFTKACVVAVYSDLIAAGRVLFRDEKGLACILGTGASLAFYKNGDLQMRIPSLGFPLGDEASGAYLGKTICNLYFTKSLPQDLSEAFEKKYSIKYTDFISEFRKCTSPNKFLAEYTFFLYEQRSHMYINLLLTKIFTDYFEQYVLKYPEDERNTIGFVGSVAWLFSDFLKKIAEKNGLIVRKIIRYPLNELCAYHLMQKS